MSNVEFLGRQGPAVAAGSTRMSKPKSRAPVYFSGLLLFSMGTVAQGQATALNESTHALNRGEYGKASELAKAHLQNRRGRGCPRNSGPH